MSKIKFDLRSGMGDTVGEYLHDLPLEIDADGEGLWAIVAAGLRVSLDNSHANRIRALRSGVQLTEIAKRGSRPWAMSKEDSLTIMAEVDAALIADPEYDKCWFDILVTDAGHEMSRRIFDRRGYQGGSAAECRHG